MKDSLTPWFMCESKIRHGSKKCAENALRKIRKTGMIVSPDAHAYKCPFCQGWHLGHTRGRYKK